MSAAESRTPATALEWALAYAALGWSVVPVRAPEKVPAEAWLRYQSMPADANKIRSWFDQNPSFGVGLVMGATVGLIALDFDGEEGMALRAQWEARGMPIGPTSLTGSGGCHMLFRHPGRRVPTRKKVVPGLDVRGDGGFIVAPPSLHGVEDKATGRYVATGRAYHWDVDAHPDDVAIPDLPDWIEDIICADVPGTAGVVVELTRAVGSLGLQGAVSDGREAYMRDTVLAVAADLYRKNGALPSAEQVIEAGWDQYARNVDFTRPGRGRAEFAAKVQYTLARAAKGAIRGFEAEGNQSKTAEDQRIQGENGAGGNRSTLPVIRFGAVEPNLDAADFIEGLLIEAAMSVIYGPSNCGKTFFCTDLALHVAAGWAWRGREVEAGGVIYCALEGAHGIKNRVAAFKAHHGILDGLPFGIVPVTLNLLDPEADTQRLIDTIKAEGEALGVPVKWVVMDTLSRAMAGGNENSPEDMGALVTNGTRIQQETGAHVTWIHHSGKDDARGARGHSLLRAATDTEIEISRADSASPSVARVTKQRDLEIEGEFVFKLASVELGKNRRGKAVTSCVVEVVDGDAPARAPRLSRGAVAALEALREALAKDGSAVSRRDIPENVPVVALGTWRAEFYARSTLDSQEARKKAFQRAIRDLTDVRKAMVMHDVAWIVKED